MQKTRHWTRLLTALVGFLAVLSLGVGIAAAQEPYVSDDGQTQGPTGQGGEGLAVQGSQVVRAQSATSTLPLTGAEMATLAVCGIGFVLIGAAFVAGTRRPTEV